MAEKPVEKGRWRSSEARSEARQRAKNCALGRGDPCFGAAYRMHSPANRWWNAIDGYFSKPIRTEFLRNEIERLTGGDMRKQPMETAAEKPRQFEWDLKELMERLGGDQELFHDLLVMFRGDVQMNLQKSHTAIGKGDYEELSRTAHTIKGMLRNLSMGAAAEIAAALERASWGSLQMESKELLEALTKELEGILPEVEAQLAEVKP
jgi:HPt (histidine-containing phosphotransfer) domain-containing protein